MRSEACEVATPKQRKSAKLVIRFVRKTDRTCTAEIDSDCFNSSADEFKSTRKSKVVVAVQKGVIVGYIRYDIEKDQLYLANVCVAEDARGENICKKMVRWLTKKLVQYKLEKITLYATNAAAAACYRKAGFTGGSESGGSMEYVKPPKKKRKKKDE